MTGSTWSRFDGRSVRTRLAAAPCRYSTRSCSMSGNTRLLLHCLSGVQERVAGLDLRRAVLHVEGLGTVVEHAPVGAIILPSAVTAGLDFERVLVPARMRVT